MRALMDRVAGAGLSGAKEAAGFRAGALQPRPPFDQLLTENQGLLRKPVAEFVRTLICYSQITNSRILTNPATTKDSDNV